MLKTDNKNRNGFWRHPKTQNFMERLQTATYDDAMRMIYSSEQRQVFREVCGEGYDTNPRKKLRFDIACAVIGQFEIEPNQNRYITQSELFRLLECSNPAYLELYHKNYEDPTAQRAQKEPLSMIVGSAITQFFKHCGGQMVYKTDNAEFLIYPLRPKMRCGAFPEYTSVLFQTPHITKNITDMPEEVQSRIRDCEERLKNLSSEYKKQRSAIMDEIADALKER